MALAFQNLGFATGSHEAKHSPGPAKDETLPEGRSPLDEAGFRDRRNDAIISVAGSPQPQLAANFPVALIEGPEDRWVRHRPGSMSLAAWTVSIIARRSLRSLASQR